VSKEKHPPKTTVSMKHNYILFRPTSQLPFLLLLALCSLSTGLYAQMPTNLDFGSGNFTNWKCWVGYSTTGTATTGAAFTSSSVTPPIGGSAPHSGIPGRSRHYITSGSDTDYYGGFPIVSPLGGPYSLRIGTDSIMSRAERVQYFIHVPAATTSYNVQIQYAIVFEDPSHGPADQPAFQIVAYDSATGAIVPAGNNLYISGNIIPGFVLRSATANIWTLPWTTSTINLSGMAGKTIVLECTALACTPGGHMGYGYFDVVSVSNTLAASLVRYNIAGDSVVLQGPPGYASYRWYNQNFSKVFNAAGDSARTKTLPAPIASEYYNLVIKPYAATGVSDTIQSPLLHSKLGIAPAASPIATVYPNPSATQLHITFASPFNGSVSLVNSQGQVVYTKHLPETVSYDVPTGSFAAGTYSLLLKDDKGGNQNALPISIAR
jgi:hypothetical protein